jgi:glyoxylase-like metal-dependent hydrolase (beta-lactamase superfamily II)
MEIESFYEPESGTWTHLLADSSEKIAAIIDPVWVFDPVSGMADTSFIDKVLAAAERAGYRVEWVLETHAHADHLTAADIVRQRNGAKIACGRGICGVQENFARVFNMTDSATDGSQFDRLLEEGDVIRLGQLEVRVMETPGHTGDSITYLAENAAFIGDTLFTPAFGSARCDFPGGDAAQLFDSIMKLYDLPEETRLFLCHDYPGAGKEPVRDITVKESRLENIHITAETTKAEFVAMRTNRDRQLGLPRLILPSLQLNIRAGAAPQTDSNGVTYLRIPFNRAIADLIKVEP